MEEIGKILPAVFKTQVRRAEPPLVELLTPLWSRVVGRAIARCSHPIGFSEGVLTLAVSCPTWTTQLRELREDVRAKINTFLGAPIVKRLNVRYVPDLVPPEVSARRQDRLANSGTAKPGRTVGPPPEGPGPPDGTEDLDAETSEILARSFAKYFARKGKAVH